MPEIHLTTVIHAPRQRVFDLSRCVSLHKRHFDRHKILAKTGKTSGLLEMRDYTMWVGKMGRKRRQLVFDIVVMEEYDFYRDEIRRDFFESFSHEHFFKQIDNGTIMIDQISFQLPQRLLGNLMRKSCVEERIEVYLRERNGLIKEYAEGDNWRTILP